jgi:hypothetical protein
MTEFLKRNNSNSIFELLKCLSVKFNQGEKIELLNI